MYFPINVTVSWYPILLIFLTLKNRPIRWRTLYFRSVYTGLETHPSSYPVSTQGLFPQTEGDHCVKLTIHTRLLPNLWIRGAETSLPDVPESRE